MGLIAANFLTFSLFNSFRRLLAEARIGLLQQASHFGSLKSVRALWPNISYIRTCTLKQRGSSPTQQLHGSLSVTLSHHLSHVPLYCTKATAVHLSLNDIADM